MILVRRCCQYRPVQKRHGKSLHYVDSAQTQCPRYISPARFPLNRRSQRHHRQSKCQSRRHYPRQWILAKTGLYYFSGLKFSTEAACACLGVNIAEDPHNMMMFPSHHLYGVKFTFVGNFVRRVSWLFVIQHFFLRTRLLVYLFEVEVHDTLNWNSSVPLRALVFCHSLWKAGAWGP